MEDDPDEVDKSYGMEIVYVNAKVIHKRASVGIFFEPGHPLNKRLYLPGKHQTKNCALIYGVRELLKGFRKQAQHQYLEDRVPILIVRSDTTYLVDGVNQHRFVWRRNDWRKKNYKRVANFVFWQSLDSEIEQLNKMGIQTIFEFVPYTARHPKLRLAYHV